MADDKIIDFSAKKAEGIANKNNAEKNDQSVISDGLKTQTTMKVNLFRDGESVEVDPSTVDVQTTINVKNPEIDLLIEKFCEEKTDQNLTALVSKLETARVLLPGQLMGEKKVPVPLTVNTSEGEILQPVFTDKEKIAAAPKSQIVMNLPFAIVVAQVMDKGPNIAGIAINPFGKSVVFKRELLEKIMEVIKKKAMSIQRAKEEQIVPGVENGEVTMRGDGTTVTQLKLSEDQYNVLERAKFEREFLPKKFFKGGELFIEEIAEEKAAYIDHLFEESYIEKRVYPYLQDEFKVMYMGVSETLDVVTVTMPKDNVSAGMAETIYMAWDKKANKGRFFILAYGKKKNEREMYEIYKNSKSEFLGAAPEEGTEISWLLDKINGGSEA